MEETENKPVDSLDYRGYHVDFFVDDYGQQFYTTWQGEEIGFGTYNTAYKEDMKLMIDDKLDTVKRYKWGAKLTYFDNFGHRDIELIYRQRILMVWLEEDNLHVQDIIIEADELIKELGVGE